MKKETQIGTWYGEPVNEKMSKEKLLEIIRFQCTEKYKATFFNVSEFVEYPFLNKRWYHRLLMWIDKFYE